VKYLIELQDGCYYCDTLRVSDSKRFDTERTLCLDSATLFTLHQQAVQFKDNIRKGKFKNAIVRTVNLVLE
jgi:hypothetical protein